MRYILNNYQGDAIKALIDYSGKLIDSQEKNKYILLKAITGAGKTVMMAGYIEEIFKEYNNITFVWISIGDGGLHDQSKKSLEHMIDGSIKIKSPQEALTDDYLREKEVLVLNWESINTKKFDKETGKKEFANILMRKGENKNLINIWENTHKHNNRIILIIDESHYTATSTTSKEIINTIKPIFTVEMTATPEKSRIPNKEDENRCKAFYVPVDTERVVNREVIKKSIKINEISESEDDEESIIGSMVKLAAKKRNDLKTAYKDELEVRKQINPLCLIQLPDADEGKETKELVLKYLEDSGVDIKNNVAIWLNNNGKTEKTYNDEVKNNDSNIDFLIFKKAVGTGWNCPRASILVRLRDIKSVTFDLQTIGRILRMPDRKFYNNDILNHGYIYTNADYTLNCDDYKAVLPQLQVIQEKFKDEVLSMSFKVEKVEYGDTPIDERTLEGSFKNKIIKQSIDFNIENLSVNIKSLVKDTAKLDELNKKGSIDIKDERKITLKTSDVNRGYVRLLKGISNKYYPYKSIDNTIKKHFKELGLKNEEIKKVVLLNKGLIEQCFIEIKQNYKNTISTYVVDKTFTLKEDRSTKEKKTIVYQKCAYFKHFVSNYVTETTFEEYLESLCSVKYWIKNVDAGDGISLVYEYNNIKREFYPDYMVKFNDGSIGLYEVKDIADKEKETITKVKIERLKDYSIENNFKCGLVEIKDRDVYTPTLPNELK